MPLNYKKDIIKNEKGLSGLVIVIVIGTLLVIFAASLTLMTVIGTQSSLDRISSDDNYYMAESGAEDALRILLLDSSFSPTNQTISTPLGDYVADVTEDSTDNYTLKVQTNDGNTYRSVSVAYEAPTSSLPDAADYSMFGGGELSFVHFSNAGGNKGRMQGNVYAKDRVKFVRFIVGDSTGAETTNIISAGSYGEGGGIGSMRDRFDKNSETYYTNLYTLNDVYRHTSAYADHLTVYYRDSSQQNINLPTGPDNQAIEDSNLLVEELTNPIFDFDGACRKDPGETENIYTYSNAFWFMLHANSVNGHLETGVHCIESGDVILLSGFSGDLNFDGSIIAKNGDLIILNKITATNSFNLPILAAKERLLLGKTGGNQSSPHSMDMTGIIYSQDDLWLGNFGNKTAAADPSFRLVGAAWSGGDIYVYQHSSIPNMNVEIIYDQPMAYSVRGFSGEDSISQIKLKSWDETFE